MKSGLTQNEMFKKYLNRKVILGVSAILLAIVFIGITSFVPFAITEEKLGSAKFWTDELIIIAITIFAMVAAMFVGQASNAQDPKSELAKAKVGFVESFKLILNMNFFTQWVKRVLQPQDIQSIKERELRKIGIDDYDILKLEDHQIKELAKNAQKYNGNYYSQITEKQALAILDLKDGVKRIHLVEPSYYLTVSSIEADKTDSEKSGKEQFVKTMRLIFSVGSKILLTLIPALIFAALARDLGAEEDAAEAWATFIARMFALLSSAFMGYLVGCQTNDIDADYINLKSRIHRRYLQDESFKPLSKNELAKQEYIERVKKENAEYGKSLNLKDREELDVTLPAVVSE